MHRRWSVVALLVTMVGCGVDADDSLRAAVTSVPEVVSVGANGDVVQVLALDNNYLPQTVTVAAGTEVLWVNNGRNDHNIVPEGDPQATTWGVLDADFAPTMTWSRVFDTPGTYVYYCTIHGTASAAMFGTVVVTAP